MRRPASIQVTEAAKVIENTQRDLNIAFVNELAIIFHRLGLDTTEVLEEVNVLGLAFKENTPDLRNSRVIDVIRELRSYGVEVFVHDPVVSAEEAKEEYGLELAAWSELPVAAATILADAHREFLARPLADFAEKTQREGWLIDVKSKLDPEAVQRQGLKLWRL